MKTILTNSWHYKVWKFIQPGSDKDIAVPTVCGYWTDIFIKVPLACFLFAILFPFIPIIWLIEKIEARGSKISCPMGRVNFVEVAQKQK